MYSKRTRAREFYVSVERKKKHDNICCSCYRRVHISEKTLQCLSGEFEVEPAFGEKREETLRIAGLKTYFIKKVLIPVSCDQKFDLLELNLMRLCSERVCVF